jgi:hypothetical protein
MFPGLRDICVFFLKNDICVCYQGKVQVVINVHKAALHFMDGVDSSTDTVWLSSLTIITLLHLTLITKSHRYKTIPPIS